MRRHGTGAQTTSCGQRIELSYLLKHGFIQKGEKVSGVLSWQRRGENTGNISIESQYHPGGESYLRLSYRLTEDDQVYDLDYRIALFEKASNLGKGSVLYLVCPESGMNCRVLYRAYGCHRWKAREAYKNRLYYPIQLSSKMDRYNDRYWELDKQLTADRSRRLITHYKGQLTKRSVKRQKLELLQQQMDYLRWSSAAMPLNLRRAVFKEE